MGAKPKVRKTAKPATKAKKKAPKKGQRERFIEAAREAGVTEVEFERLFAKVAPPISKPKEQKGQ